MTKILLTEVETRESEAFESKYDMNAGMGGVTTQGEFRSPSLPRGLKMQGKFGSDAAGAARSAILAYAQARERGK